LKTDYIHLSTDVAPVSGDSPSETLPGRPGSRSKMKWAVQGYAVLPNLFDDGVYISDHRAVVGDVMLTSQP
jgi:hypothetical protein